MPTYTVGEGWAAIASKKSYLSFYTCGYHHIASFKERNPEITTGKGCINFRDKDDIPIKDLVPVIKQAIEHAKEVRSR